ncbi:MAG TPA: AMP-binding protein [Caldimonas sp.]|nr:AMP-binding protein [Caldimonas sp.]HEX4234548.1 AMP-binding protein [Caldimonas sp.]
MTLVDHAPREHYDALETRSPDEREAALARALPAQIAHAMARAPAIAARLRGVDAATVTSRAALAALPVLRKGDLLAMQNASAAPDAFGGFATVGWGASRPPAERASRVFFSPGPIREPETARADYWRMARALFAAGFRGGDLVHNSFSYHLTPAGSMMESGALALGCTVFPGGTGQTEQQLQAMIVLAPTAYTGTPSFLRVLLEKADEGAIALPSLARASLGGEAVPGLLVAWLGQRGIAAFQTYGTADLGLVAYETAAREGLVVDEGVVVEIVAPGTGEPVEDGEIGELVVTTLNPDYPLVRYATGDLSATLPGTCPTGRTNRRIRGWLGRADQSTKVRGMFVHPSQVGEIARRHPQVVRARLIVDGAMADDRMTLHIEAAAAAEGLGASVAQTIRDVTKLRGEVAVVAPGSLPADGKLIEDRRSSR